jgi:protocatechuate 3,4-dioxygenase beta subunit
MPTDRRRFMAWTGLGALATTAPATRALPTADGACVAAPLPLTPQVTEGPFYLDAGLVRSDITEGLGGVPLEVRIRVVDVRAAPLSGLRVDLWHCDATGAYSGFEGPRATRGAGARGKTFLRGTVLADRDGVAAFRTIYPGWYEGRTTHIHLKVYNGKHAVLTSQLFLPDALSEYLYTNLPAYRRDALRDTLNRRDGIALEAGPAACGAVREDADRYVVEATTVVDPDARPPVGRPPGVPGTAGRGPRGARSDRPDASGVRPSFQVGNQGGNVRGGVGLSGGFGHDSRPGGTPSDGPPPGPGEGPPPFVAGPRPEVLQGDARVAVIVPGR